MKFSGDGRIVAILSSHGERAHHLEILFGFRHNRYGHPNLACIFHGRVPRNAGGSRSSRGDESFLFFLHCPDRYCVLPDSADVPFVCEGGAYFISSLYIERKLILGVGMKRSPCISADRRSDRGNGLVFIIDHAGFTIDLTHHVMC